MNRLLAVYVILSLVVFPLSIADTNPVDNFIVNEQKVENGSFGKVSRISDDGVSSKEEDIRLLESFNMDLKEGWNLISIPLVQSNNSLPAAFDGNYTVIFAYDDGWASFNPDRPYFLNLLNHTDVVDGYWVEMDSNQTVEFSGNLSDDVYFDILEGWNLIGYPSLDVMPINESLSEVMDIVEIVFEHNASNDTYLWRSFSPEKPNSLNTLEDFTPGKGYWLQATDNETWLFNGTHFLLEGCDDDSDCEATQCDYLDGCYGNDYHDYDDVPNSCTAGSCEENECTIYSIIEDGCLANIDPYIIEPAVSHYIYTEESVPVIYNHNVTAEINGTNVTKEVKPVIKVVDLLKQESINHTEFEYYNGTDWVLIETDYNGGYEGECVQNGSLLMNCSSGWSVEWDVSSLEGAYTIRATMYNADGGYVSDERSVYVDPTPPLVEIISPVSARNGAVNGNVLFNVSSNGNGMVLRLYAGSNSSYTQSGLGSASQYDVGDNSTSENNYCAPTAAANGMWKFGDLHGNHTNATSLAKDLAGRMNTSRDNGTAADDIKKGIEDYLAGIGEGCQNEEGYKVSCICDVMAVVNDEGYDDCEMKASDALFEEYDELLREGEAIIIGIPGHVVTGHDVDTKAQNISYIDPKNPGTPTTEHFDPDSFNAPFCFWAVSPKNKSESSVGITDEVPGSCADGYCTATYDTNLLLDGFHTFEMAVSDGLYKGEERLVVYSDNNDPVPIIDSPSAGTVNGTITIEVYDDLGSEDIASVMFVYENSSGDIVEIGVDDYAYDGWSVEWNTTEVEDGSYTVIAEMLDYAGNMGNETVGIEVDNVLSDWTVLVEDNYDDGDVPQAGDGNYVLTERNGAPANFSELGWSEAGGVLTMVGPVGGATDLFATNETSFREVIFLSTFNAVETSPGGSYGVQVGKNDLSNATRLIVNNLGSGPEIQFLDTNGKDDRDVFNNTATEIQFRLTRGLTGLIKAEYNNKIGGDWGGWQEVGTPSDAVAGIDCSGSIFSGHSDGIDYHISYLLLKGKN